VFLLPMWFQLRSAPDWVSGTACVLILSASVPDTSRWRHGWSDTLARNPGASQLRRWPLDSKDLWGLQSGRWLANRLGGPTKSVFICFNCGWTREAKYACVTRFGLETDVHFLGVSRFSPGKWSRQCFRLFNVDDGLHCDVTL
jgi:hypothetical protein